MGSPADNAAFWKKLWPEATAILDSNEVLYDAFGIRDGSWTQLLKPSLWWKYIKAMPSGMGIPRGNTLRNPGAVLVHKRVVIARQDADDFGLTIDIEPFIQIASDV